MKVLIIYAHPNPASFNAGLLQTIREELEKNALEYNLRNLYELQFDPVFSGAELGSVFTGKGSLEDVQFEQSLITKSDLLIFVYPIWWFGPPAILKGYIDRVFTHGFSFAFGPEGVTPMMKGKKAFVVQTGGNTPEAYAAYGLTDVPKDTMEKGILQFMGFQTHTHTLLAVQQISEEERINMLKSIQKNLKSFLNS